MGTKCVGITIAALAPKSRRPFLVAKVFMIAQRPPAKLGKRGFCTIRVRRPSNGSVAMR